MQKSLVPGHPAWGVKSYVFGLRGRGGGRGTGDEEGWLFCVVFCALRSPPLSFSIPLSTLEGDVANQRTS